MAQVNMVAIFYVKRTGLYRATAYYESGKVREFTAYDFADFPLSVRSAVDSEAFTLTKTREASAVNGYWYKRIEEV